MKTIVITGANVGIGLETAKNLVNQGHKVILACRNLEKANHAKQQLDAIGQEPVDIIQLDLNNLKQVTKAAHEVINHYSQIDVLINNAGLINTKLESTEQGFEKHIGVNYLGHFLWTMKLLPLLKKSSQARIIHLSSIAHLGGNINFNKFKAENIKHYQTFLYYANSKLANLLFSHHLAKLLEGTNITSNALHPGVVDSDLYRQLPKYQYKVVGLFLIPPSKPAQLITQMALDDDWAKKNGQYASVQTPAIQSRKAKNTKLAESLYEHSLQLLKEYL